MVKGEDLRFKETCWKITAITWQAMMRDQTKIEKEEDVGAVNSKGS